MRVVGRRKGNMVIWSENLLVMSHVLASVKDGLNRNGCVASGVRGYRSVGPDGVGRNH